MKYYTQGKLIGERTMIDNEAYRFTFDAGFWSIELRIKQVVAEDMTKMTGDEFFRLIEGDYKHVVEGLDDL